MRILVTTPGRLRTVPMGGYLATAMAQLGHEVKLLSVSAGPLARFAGRAGLKAIGARASVNRRFRALVGQFSPDLVVSLYGRDLDDESCALCRDRGIPHVCWWLNDPFQLASSLPLACRYDAVFTNCSVSPADYMQAGVRHAYWLPTACDPDVHRPMPPQAALACEVCFAGDWSPLRERVCERIAARYDLRVMGPWARKIRPRSPLKPRLADGFFSASQMASAFSSAKVVLNLHTWHEHQDHGTNPRLFEAAGCATCQVVDWKREIPELFDCDSELVTYRAEGELEEVIGELLRDSQRRTAIAAAARLRASSCHTYAHRAAALIERTCVIGLCPKRSPRGAHFPW
ncbi:MAG: glycosyltransferase [Phycisphaerales bacterium]|nr:glycosyltransferase [Phycisphaerales bacterium]